MRFPTLPLAFVAALSAAGLAAARQQPDGTPPPTFTRDIAPILYENCASCHRPGEIGPMALLTYEQARPWARAIARQVQDRRMPPWHAEAPPGTFTNERRLSAEEMATIDWASGGAPQGDPRDLPPQPRFADGWTIGEPDLTSRWRNRTKCPRAVRSIISTSKRRSR